MFKLKTRPILISLLLLEWAYVSFWGLGIIVLKLQWWPPNLLGLNGYNILSEINAIQVFWVYAMLASLTLSIVLVLQKNKLAIPTYLISAMAHVFLWLSLLDNNYFNSQIGFIIITQEVAIIILMLIEYKVSFGFGTNPPQS